MFRYNVILFCLMFVFRKFAHTFSYEGKLTRNTSFDDIYLTENRDVFRTLISTSRTECALQCLLLKPVCVGVRFNEKECECQILRLYINEKAINNTDGYSLPGIGWEYWPQHNVCPKDWFPYDGHCYFLNKTATSWNNSKELCEENGAYLLQVGDYEENDWIWETFLSNLNQGVCPQSSNSCGIWIGAPGRGEFSYLFPKNKSLSNFNDLRSKIHPFSHCFFFRQNGLWDYDMCHIILAFVCEKE